MRSSLPTRAAALILSLSVASEAVAADISRIAPELRAGAPAVAVETLSLPSLQVTATLGRAWPAGAVTIEASGPAAAAAALGPDVQAAPQEAGAGSADAPRGAADAASVTETTRLASERVPEALARGQAALTAAAAGPGDIKVEAAKARQPVLKLARPATDSAGAASSSIAVAEPASKKVSELRNLLNSDPEAGLKEAERRLSDPEDARVEIRLHAGRVIAEHAGDEATGVLTAALTQEKNWYARRELAFALGNRASRPEPGREAAIDALKGALADANDSVHLMAHWALTQFGVDSGPERPLVVEKPVEEKPPKPSAWRRFLKGAANTAMVTGILAMAGGIFYVAVDFNLRHPELAQQAMMSEGGYFNPDLYGHSSSATPAAPVAPAAQPVAPKKVETVTAPPKTPPMEESLADVSRQLTQLNKTFSEKDKGPQFGFWQTLALSTVPMLLMVGLMGGGWWLLMRPKKAKKDKDDKDKPKDGAAGPMDGGNPMLKANAKTTTGDGTRFSDLAGIENAMATMNEVVDYLRNPLEFKARGGKMPKGLLLVGPPGTGKTAIARALANEAEVPFFSISGSDFVEMFVGVGASRVRDLFAQAKAAGRAIIFIDEIDAVGGKRGGLNKNDEREQTLNQLLVEMDGFAAEAGILLIGATNRPDTLDEALLRPGRFNRQVQVTPADVIGREAILERHARFVPLAPDVDLKQVAERSPGRSGAFLMNFVNEAALNATKYRRRSATAKDFDVGLTRAIIGDANPMVMDEAEKLRTSYHEAGHVFAGQVLNKVTIIPHGPALGYAEPAEDIQKFNLTKKQAMEELVILMGGRVAEELAFGHVEDEESSAGASNDFERASDLARNMVQRWGMSKEVGYVVTAPPAGNPYAQVKVSEQTQALIDAQIKAIIQKAHDAAEKKLRARWSDLEAMAKDLMKHETLYRQDIERYTKPHQAPKS